MLPHALESSSCECAPVRLRMNVKHVSPGSNFDAEVEEQGIHMGRGPQLLVTCAKQVCRVGAAFFQRMRLSVG